MTYSSRDSKSSSLDRKITREINIREIKEEDMDNESDQNPNKYAYYISDGTHQEKRKDKSIHIEDFFSSSVSYYFPQILNNYSKTYMIPINHLLKAQETCLIVNTIQKDSYQMSLRLEILEGVMFKK